MPIGAALERPVTKGFIEVLHKQVLKNLDVFFASVLEIPFYYLIQLCAPVKISKLVLRQTRLDIHSGCDKNYLLFLQLGSKPIIERSSLEEKWRHLSLPDDKLYEILR